MDIIPIELPQRVKRCPRCGSSKPWTEYTIRSDRGTPAAWCKACNCERVKAAYKPHPKVRAPDKACKGCGLVLPVDQFPIKSTQSGWRTAICRECKNRKALEYKGANRAKVQASNAAYRESRRKELAERQRTWREANPERYFDIHSSWKKRNPDAVRAMGNKRRVLVEQAGPHYTAAEWTALKAEFDQRCLMCWRQPPAIRLTVDHVVPISRDGNNTIDNLQPLCKSCNSKKHRGVLDLRPEARTRLRLE